MDNPCALEWKRLPKSGLSFILNIVKNLNGEIIGVFGGDLSKLIEEGLQCQKRLIRLRFLRQLTSSWLALPLATSTLASRKGLIAGYFAVKPGGIIIFAAPCPEGLAHNHPKFREWLALH